ILPRRRGQLRTVDDLLAVADLQPELLSLDRAGPPQSDGNRMHGPVRFGITRAEERIAGITDEDTQHPVAYRLGRGAHPPQKPLVECRERLRRRTGERLQGGGLYPCCAARGEGEADAILKQDNLGRPTVAHPQDITLLEREEERRYDRRLLPALDLHSSCDVQ